MKKIIYGVLIDDYEDYHLADTFYTTKEEAVKHMLSEINDIKGLAEWYKETVEETTKKLAERQIVELILTDKFNKGEE